MVSFAFDIFDLIRWSVENSLLLHKVYFGANFQFKTNLNSGNSLRAQMAYSLFFELKTTMKYSSWLCLFCDGFLRVRAWITHMTPSAVSRKKKMPHIIKCRSCVFITFQNKVNLNSDIFYLIYSKTKVFIKLINFLF